MKKITSIFLLITITGCYTQLVDKSSTSAQDDIKPILDENVFLPDSLFSNPEYSIKHLFKMWVNSFEEEKTFIKIYRPENYKDFPASRYRNRINFHENGECEYWMPSPIDAHYFGKFRWRILKENTNIFFLYDKNAMIFKRIRIEKLDTDILKFVIIIE